MTTYRHDIPEHTIGGVTLPAEVGQEEKVAELVCTWGADAIRDSDGTALSPELMNLGVDLYSTICLVRSDQEWPRQHPDQVHRKFLMSDPVTALSAFVTITLLNGYHPEKYAVDSHQDSRALWQVFDRTTGDEVAYDKWSYDADSGTVTLSGIEPFHVYTVNFLARVIWDTTSMYNHVVNQWDRPHVISVDPYHRLTWDHLLKYFRDWVQEHPQTSVIRLTTLAYHFNVDFDERAQDKFRDWTGYQETVSLEALEDFEKENGYPLSSEDFVDQGCYNATVRVPSERYLDWMEFIQRFVVRFGKALVAEANAAGKKTAIFHGDHWIGVEPFSSNCEEMGIDIHIGAAEDGVALRRVADTLGPHEKEVRLYPYFFPDVFRDGGDPLSESISNWIKIRRALMRKPIDRIGYGGYLSLAAKFPEFVRHVEDLCHEFRSFKTMTLGTESLKAPVKVAVLNAWGRSRAWINSFGHDQKFLVKRQDVIQVAGTNLLECLAGLSVEVDFISFRDIKRSGIPDDVDVLINDGDAGTAWSGGRYWTDATVVSAVREFVARGGGLIACRGATACPHQGRTIQLSDVTGVEKESGQSLQNASLAFGVEPAHFITEDLSAGNELYTDKSYVFVADRATRVLCANGGHVTLACKDFGGGRSVYVSELPYSLENSRLLLRAILWAARREDALTQWNCSNLNTDCAFYPATQRVVVVNNVDREQTTLLYDGRGVGTELTLAPCESRWLGVAL